jgi:hypothetical protein
MHVNDMHGAGHDGVVKAIPFHILAGFLHCPLMFMQTHESSNNDHVLCKCENSDLGRMCKCA